HPHSRVVVAVGCKQQQLLDALVIQRTLRFLGQNRVVLDAHLIRSRLLRYGSDARNRRRLRGLIGRRIAATRFKRTPDREIPASRGKKVVSCANASTKSHDENRRCQGRRHANLPQPGCGLKNQALPKPALARRFERLLQPHARRRQQIRSRLRHGLRKRGVEFARRFQFRSAFRTPPQVLLDFVAGVVLQFVVHIEQNVLPHPITFHFRIPSRGLTFELIASPPARPAVFASREIMCSLPSLPSYSASRPRCATSARDSASTRTPSAREASAPTAPRRSCAPVPAALNRVPDWLPSAHPQTVPTGCILRRMRPPPLEHLPCAHSVSADDRGRDW